MNQDIHCPHMDPSDQQRQDRTDDEWFAELGYPSLKKLWNAETIRQNELPSDDEIEQTLQNQWAQAIDDDDTV